jgi:hypothetical protein
MRVHVMVKRTGTTKGELAEGMFAAAAHQHGRHFLFERQRTGILHNVE